MADSFSVERRRLMRMLGAKVVLTPRAQKGFGMYLKAAELAEKNGWFLARQFETAGQRRYPRGDDRPRDHQRFRRIDGSTISSPATAPAAPSSGVGRVLRRNGRRRRSSSASRPTRSSSAAAPPSSESDGAPAASHPAFEPHPIQGWTPDFIPDVLQEAHRQEYYDELVPIAGPKAIEWARQLAQKEGIFTGISGGATLRGRARRWPSRRRRAR